MDDPFPSIHAVLDTADPEQRGIGHGKTVLDTVRVRVLFYSLDYRDIWKMYQTIKQIIVGNNQVNSTEQYDSTGIEWTMVGPVDFDIIATAAEQTIDYFDMVVSTVYQDSY